MIEDLAAQFCYTDRKDACRIARIHVDDLFSVGFIAVAKSIDGLAHADGLLGWVKARANGEFLDYARKELKEAHFRLPDYSEQPSESPSDEKIDDLIDALTPDETEREALRLMRQGYSQKEIAARTGLSTPTLCRRRKEWLRKAEKNQNLPDARSKVLRKRQKRHHS